MKTNEMKTIGEWVANDYRTAEIFKKYDIDFCCNGNRSIEEACQSKNLEVQGVMDELETKMAETQDKGIDFGAWPLDLLADYIEKTHHRYVETKITEIKPYLEKIVKVHGKNHPELEQIQGLFLHSAGELTQHMKKEELVLFPFIRKMVAAKQTHTELAASHFGSVRNPIAMMMQEHDNEGENFRKIRALSQEYTAPEDACNTFRVTFALLQEFEEDLHHHIHLENNILFPKAEELERELA